MTPILKVGHMPSKKPGTWAPMGATVRTLFGLLGLLLVPAGASQDGELCLGWLPSPIDGFLPFRCPQHPDGTDGPFCCGTCTKPYCCDSEEDRLDQDECLHVWRMLRFSVSAMMTERPTSDPQTQEVTSVGSSWKMQLTGAEISVFAGVGTIILLLFTLLLCDCCLSGEFYKICRRFRDGEVAQPLNPAGEMPRPTPLREETMAAVLRDLEECLSNLSVASPAMEGATTRTQTRIPAPPVCGPEVAAAQASPTSAATSDAATTGVVTPELAAATGGENPPVQGDAGGGMDTAGKDATGGGEDTASTSVPPVPDQMST